MVVNAPESPTQAGVIFVVEATAANGAYISELTNNYLVPTLEYFHGGALEEGGGNGSVYGVVAYRAADCFPGLPVSTFGPFTTPQHVLEAVEKIHYIGGHAESRACVTEALATALLCCDDLGRTDIPLHIILLCSSPPYSAYGGGLVPPGAPSTPEQAARLISERGVQLSIAASRRIPALPALYEHAGGDLHSQQQRNYAKDPRHMVLLRGYSLAERAPSPAPPPAPDAQPDVYGQNRQTGARPPAPLFPRMPGQGGQVVQVGQVGPVGQVGQTGQIGQVGQVGQMGQVGQVGQMGQVGQVGQAGQVGQVRSGWPAPQRPQIYNTNSALLTQLAQPSYPPPPTAQRMPSLLSPGPPSAAAPPAGSQRSIIWNGIIEWMEKGKGPGDQQKTVRHLPCQVSAGSKDVEPELKVVTWPSKLLMQLMPKQLISNIGGEYLKDSKSVLFHLQPSEALDALTKVMVNGFAGCVHFSPNTSPPQCDIKVLILLYTPDKKAYLGFIPNNQATFVDRLRKVIQQQKISQIINKQQPAVSSAMPTSTMAGSMPTPGMSTGGMGNMGSSSMGQALGQMSGPATQLQHPQGMMVSGGMQQVQNVGGLARGGAALDGLEVARQQNLEKIQHLQQTLEAAHQQQYKSQRDIMSHLHAAQQQEQHYKQLELQQQIQQLRGAGAHAPRLLRPLLPSNPGLRHLLQQQPQYRPGGAATRPSTQTQQFEDVSNYDFLQ